MYQKIIRFLKYKVMLFGRFVFYYDEKPVFTEFTNYSTVIYLSS